MKSTIKPHQRSKGLQYYYDNIDRLKPINAARAKAYYYKNKEKKLKQNAEWRSANKEAHAKMKKAWNKRRFFYSKAVHIKATKRGSVSFETPTQLARGLMFQWIKQRGLCALTGARLDRSAHADHIIPACKGGTDNSNNFQWLSPNANHFKGALSVHELADMCRLVLKHIGKESFNPPRT